MDFDRSDSVVVAGNRVYFGSVGDGIVYCLDSQTGKPVWRFPTGGPVRLAPTVSGGRVYVGSDDGWVYCLGAEDGSVKWSLRAAPEDWNVVGSGSLVSLWPVRTSVLVADGIAYFAAGIFESEGVLLYAVDAATGRIIWQNDRFGETRLSQFSPQGYLLADKERLVVPISRQAPAIVSRANGEVITRLSIYFGGGTFAAMDGSALYTGWESARCFQINKSLSTGGGNTESLGGFPGGQLVAAGGRVYSCGLPKGEGVAEAVKAYDWKPPAEAVAVAAAGTNKTPPVAEPKEVWSAPFKNPEAIILAGSTLFVAGPGEVAALNTADGKAAWRADVPGSALSLTAANGRLYVSTDSGKIICFGQKGSPTPGRITVPVTHDAVSISAATKKAADSIMKLAPSPDKGFALVYGVENGELAVELAKRTNLKIYGISPDPAKVEAARKIAMAAGMYGSRIVMRQWPLDSVPCTPYVASLVVSETFLAGRKPVGQAAEVFRLTKPIRGAVVLGWPADGPATDSAELINGWLAGSPLAGAKIATDGGAWAVFTRGALPGAKPWTHQYANPGATASSEDESVRGPFRVQWFGDPGPSEFVDRHYWGASPLALDGRMFVCSYKSATAYDAYTGTEIWQHPMENATRAHIADVPGNVAVGPEGYFVASEDVCYRLDPATGKELARYKVPEAAGAARRLWGYVALSDSMLVGSRTMGYLPMMQWRKSRGEQVSYWILSDLLFGTDTATGKVMWQYQTPWFSQNSVVIGGGMVFFSDPVTGDGDEGKARAEFAKFRKDAPPEAGGKAAKPCVRTLVALDIKTGTVRWRRPVDWTECGGDRGTLVYKDGLLLQISDVGGCKAFNGYPVETLSGPSIAARKADTGDLVWIKNPAYRSRAVVVGDTIYAEPWSLDLRTGERKTVAHPVTGELVPWRFIRPYKHCGPFNASSNTLFFRCEGFGYYDVGRDEGVELFPSVRPNCWMSFISAEGMALWPSADTGCRCGLPLSCSVAMVHSDTNRVYGDYTLSGSLTPVKDLAVNLGGPGDRKDDNGTLWLAYPRAVYGSSMAVPLTVVFPGEPSYRKGNSIWHGLTNAASPWLYSSAAVGPSKIEVPLRAAADGKARYKVTLLFRSDPGDTGGKRIFDIKIQGKVVRKSVDVARDGGGGETGISLDFGPIEVIDNLVVELVPGGKEPPLLCGLRTKLAQN